MLSIVIPVYNGAPGIFPLWRRLRPVLEELETPSEVIFVDDGSTDGSITPIKKICMDYPSVSWLRLAENRGQQAAVLCGLRHCRGDWVVTIDDDLQHPPEFISVLVREAADGGFDAVYAVSGDGRGDAGGVLRDGFFSLLLGKPFGMKIGSFRIFSRAVVNHIIQAGGSFVYISAELFRGDFRVKSVNLPVECSGSADLPSRYGTRRRIKLYLHLVMWYTPLLKDIARLASGSNQQYRLAGKGGFS